MAADQPLNPAVRALALWGLPGTTPVIEAASPDGADLATLAKNNRLTGPLLSAAESGAVELSDAVLGDVAAAHEAALLWCLNIEHRYLRIREWFEAAGGVDHLVLKGPAIAHLDRSDPGNRTFADIDLLVRDDHIDRAVAVLVDHGATRPSPEIRPGFDRRFAKGVTCTLADDGVEVDVHRTICDGVHSVRVPRQRLFDQASSFSLGGVDVGALGRVHRVLHAAYHAVLGSPRPAVSSLRDIAVYLTDPRVDRNEVVAEAERWRGTAVLAEAVRVTTGSLGLDVPAWNEWATTVVVPKSERLILERSRREGSGIGRAKLDLIRELDGRDRVAYVQALVWPSRRFLRSRGMRRRDLLLRRLA